MFRRLILAFALTLTATALSPAVPSFGPPPPTMPCGGLYPPCI